MVVVECGPKQPLNNSLLALPSAGGPFNSAPSPRFVITCGQGGAKPGDKLAWRAHQLFT